MLVYEYIDNGNLEHWLHGDVGPVSPLTWDIRMKIAVGTAKGLVISMLLILLSLPIEDCSGTETRVSVCLPNFFFSCLLYLYHCDTFQLQF